MDKFQIFAGQIIENIRKNEFANRGNAHESEVDMVIRELLSEFLRSRLEPEVVIGQLGYQEGDDQLRFPLGGIFSDQTAPSNTAAGNAA